jgi:acyl transferase domain-containing protein/acyl-CoA synthetase (AMP-forming)/AMP-acid ligase II/acyl carrier protein/NAD(P)-dependent dehydrogenase (short-subunit alcohol dehydrogenase family)
VSEPVLAEPQSAASLVEIARRRAAGPTGGDDVAYRFLGGGEGETARLTYRDLDRRARAIAGRLQGMAAAGSRVLLLYPPGLDFVAGLFGCFYAGMAAVPAYPPAGRKSGVQRLLAIVADSGATVACSTAELAAVLAAAAAQHPGFAALRWLATDDLAPGAEKAWRDPEAGRGDLALLQYTSGSTGLPKGVMVSHGNLLSNLQFIRLALGYAPHWISVTWLPSFHDMGLVDGVLEPLFMGYTGVIMPPAAFLQRPARWLEAITRYRGTHGGGPNFGYDLCVRRTTPAELRNLDLSCWVNAYNGAEPVRGEVIARFRDAFRPAGFEARFMYPCYGLAEGTLIVTGGTNEDEPVELVVDGAALERHEVVPLAAGGAGAAGAVGGRALVGSGRPWLDTRVEIVDPESARRLPAGRVGEIWIAGSGVAQGYWQRPEASAETFGARLAGGGEGPFLRSGDLGFVHGGELFVTGRIKDMVIVRGRNHYPQDVELTVERAHAGLRPGCGAAFALEVDGEERLAVAQEVSAALAASEAESPGLLRGVALAIRQAVAEEHDLLVEAVALLAPGSLPKTSSGKVQRRACRASLLAGDLETAAVFWRRDFETAAPGAGDGTADAAPAALDGEAPAAAVAANASVPAAIVADEAALRRWLRVQLAAALAVRPDEIDAAQPLVRYGMDSARAVALTGDLGGRLGRDLSPTLFYEHPTLAELARHLCQGEPQRVLAEAEPASSRREEPTAIVVIGLGCRLPGAADPDAFWRLLEEGGDAVAEVPAWRWDAAALYDPRPQVPGRNRSRWGGFVADVERFDADLFHIAPREAAAMDPQQRLLLEVTWEALERAGIAPQRLAGSDTGVFVGISAVDYYRLPAAANLYTGTGNALSIAANRLSYVLDLRGPSLAVDTACSSSLTAVHLACRALRLADCGMAVAAGVNVLLDPALGVAFSQANLMAADGRCKTFDAAADGYVRSEGCGVVLLKRLADAERDGDRVLAVIRGSAVNQDGRSNGLTAPSGRAQREVIRRALADAGVAPAEIGYVEAHGTGTALGDPIEAAALQEVLGEGRDAAARCWIGSVKTNVGHLEAAAGIAGLIKVVLALERGRIPPHLHLRTLNPAIHFEGTPFAVPAAAVDWPAGRRLAGVSSFGFGGANAHVVLEAAPVAAHVAAPAAAHAAPAATAHGAATAAESSTLPSGASRMIAGDSTLTAGAAIPATGAPPPAAETAPASGSGGRRLHLLGLSARGEAALRELAARYAALLAGDSPPSPAEVCAGAASGRAQLDERLAVIGTNSPDLAAALASWAGDPAGLVGAGDAGGARGGGGAVVRGRARGERPRVVFLFSGQGSQRAGMGSELYAAEPVFRAAIDRCAALLGGALGMSLPDLLFGGGEHLQPTAAAQPALFALGWALAEQWQAWGVEPAAVLGHSIGELTAACVAGVVSLADGLRLAAERGRLMQELPAGGGMLVVRAAPERLGELLAGLPGGATVAAWNAPGEIVLSGRRGELQAIGEALRRHGVASRELAVDRAFHSPYVEPMLDRFDRSLAEARWSPPRLPLISNVSGAPAGAEIATPAYWRRQCREPVRFADGLEFLLAAGHEAYVEMGPEPALLSLGRRAEEAAGADSAAPPCLWLPSLRRGRREGEQMRESLARLWVEGGVTDLAGPYRGEPVRRVDLPTYPFQRQRHWVDSHGGPPLAPAAFPAVAVPPEHLPAPASPEQVAGAASPEQVAAAARPERAAVATRWDEARPGFDPASGTGSGLRSVLASGSADGVARVSAPLYRVAWPLLPPGSGEAAPVAEAAAATEASPATEAGAVPGAEVVCGPQPAGAQPGGGKAGSGGGAWLLVGEAAALLGATAEELAKAGERSVTASLGSGAETPPGGRWPIDPKGAEGAARLLAEVGELGPLAGVVYAGATRGGPAWDDDGQDPLAAGAPGCAGALHLAQALAAARWQRSPRLWLVTRGAVPAGGPPAAAGLAGSLLWGLGRTLAHEVPRLWGGLVDLAPTAAESGPAAPEVGPDDAASDARCLVASLLAADGEDQVAWRAGRRHVARLQLAAPPAAGVGIEVHAGALYVVTGGLGALGLAVAERLVASGARHLLLVARRAPEGAAQAALRRLEESGARLEVVRADVADRAAVDGLLRRIDDLRLPWRGLVHAAATLLDGTLANLTWASFEAVLAAKAAGAWNLHLASRGRPLDWFVLFSSAAAVLGSPGQANYAAANAFLGALAQHRRRAGLPATALHWGPWDDLGLARARGAAPRLAALGVRPLARGPALDAFAALAAGGQDAAAAETAVVLLAPEELRRGLLGRLPMLRDVCMGGGQGWGPDPRPGAAPAAGAALRDAPPARRRQLLNDLNDVVAGELREVLRLDRAAPVDDRRGFFDLGLDSLMAVELRNRLEARLGVGLPTSLTFDHPNAGELAAFLARLLAPPEAPASAAERPHKGGRGGMEAASGAGEPGRGNAGGAAGDLPSSAPGSDVAAEISRELAHLESLL